MAGHDLKNGQSQDVEQGETMTAKLTRSVKGRTSRIWIERPIWVIVLVVLPHSCSGTLKATKVIDVVLHRAKPGVLHTSICLRYPDTGEFRSHAALVSKILSSPYF
jgi:hypothetical protein